MIVPRSRDGPALSAVGSRRGRDWLLYLNQSELGHKFRNILLQLQICSYRAHGKNGLSYKPERGFLRIVPVFDSAGRGGILGFLHNAQPEKTLLAELCSTV